MAPCGSEPEPHGKPVPEKHQHYQDQQHQEAGAYRPQHRRHTGDSAPVAIVHRDTGYEQAQEQGGKAPDLKQVIHDKLVSQKRGVKFPGNFPGGWEAWFHLDGFDPGG